MEKKTKSKSKTHEGYRGFFQWCVLVAVLSVMAWELVNLRVMIEKLEDKLDNFDVIKRLKEYI